MSDGISTSIAQTILVEEWKPVPIERFANRYEVSSLGRVFSKVSGKILRPSPTSSGYLSVVLYDGSKPKRGKSFTVHSLVTLAFHGPCPPGMWVNHKDTNKFNNHATNLEYRTPAGNNLHAIANGVGPEIHFGSTHTNAKLTEDDVPEIRQLRLSGWSYARIGKRYGVHETRIRQIIFGKGWRHIPA